jgi:dolichyl-phosphate beta-glucosyltransferase
MLASVSWASMESPQLTVVIPAYNEEALIESTTRDIAGYLDRLGLVFEIIIVDDGSADRTIEIARRLSEEIPGVRPVSYSRNMGKGHAVRTGMLEAAGERVLFTDADNSTPIDELPALMSALDDGCGVAIGSRAVRGSVRTIHQPYYRELGGKIINLFIQFFAVPGIRDTQCGFKLFTKDAARQVFSRGVIDDFSFDVEALFLARRLGFKIAELPVHWANRGESSVRPFRDGARILTDIIRIRLHDYGIRRGGEA